MPIQWSDDYNAQTIFDQVWEAPYEWFRDTRICDSIHNTDNECVGFVIANNPNEGPDQLEYHVTTKMIDDQVIPTYKQWMDLPPDHPRFQSFTSWLDNLDANDVDAILQMAIFGEIVYG